MSLSVLLLSVNCPKPDRMFRFLTNNHSTLFWVTAFVGITIFKTPPLTFYGLIVVR
jgi:hypothetical protein